MRIFIFAVPEGLQCFYLEDTLCSCTRQYECVDVLDGFWGPGDGCRSDAGSENSARTNFSECYFRGRGFIHEYSENLYTMKISTYMAGEERFTIGIGSSVQ